MRPSPTPLIRTARLELIPWTVALVDAFASGSREDAECESGAIFPQPFASPPETDDVLEFFRGIVLADDSGGAFVPQLIVRTSDRRAIGSLGFMQPDSAGSATGGYGIYAEFEGNGYASEAFRGLVDAILLRPDVQRVRATIAVDNRASQIVASRAGLTRTGEQLQEEGLTLDVWVRNAD